LKPFPKKFIIISLLIHCFIFTVFYFISPKQPRLLSKYPLDLRYIEPQPTPPQQQVVQQIREIPVTEEPVTEKQIAKPPQQEEIKTITPAPVTPPDFMLSKTIPDSTDTIIAFINSIFDELYVVRPANIASILDYPIPEREPTMEDTLALLNAALKGILIESFTLDKGSVNDMRPLNNANMKYSPSVLSKTMPVDLLIGLGIKAASMLMKKGISFLTGDNVKKIDRMLEFDEIEVMQIIWKLKSATPQEIYTQIPVNVNLTISDIKRILQQLKGKMMISERSNFHSGQQSINLSFRQKYEKRFYSPNISRLHLVQFYDAVLSELEFGINDSGFSSQDSFRIDIIRKKIKMLTKEPFEY